MAEPADGKNAGEGALLAGLRMLGAKGKTEMKDIGLFKRGMGVSNVHFFLASDNKATTWVLGR